jgi:hypothetical protein
VKRFLIAIAAAVPVLLAGAMVTAQGEGAATQAAAAPSKLTICHKTGSASNQMRQITVSSRAMANPKSKSGKVLRAHLKHTGDAVVVGNGVPVGVRDPGTHQHTRHEDHDLPQDRLGCEPVPADHDLEPGSGESELPIGQGAPRAHATHR